MSNPDPVVAVSKKRGRPRSYSEPLAAVTTHLPPPYVDRLIEAAADRRISVSHLMRQIVIFQLKRL